VAHGVTDLGSRQYQRWMRWGIVALAVLAFFVFLLMGADRPADPSLRDTGLTSGASAAPAGPSTTRAQVPEFGEVSFRIDGTDVIFGQGSLQAARCALLAETAQQQAKGLMGRTDMGGYDAMIFKFGADTTGSFYMKDTPMPLSIAFFDEAGRFVSSTDMEPCLGKPTCPTYAAAGPYRYAIEVPKGRLGSLGIGPGTRLVLSSAGHC
jgi:uncharacterized membrane protein (UPF0127 family)